MSRLSSEDVASTEQRRHHVSSSPCHVRRRHPTTRRNDHRARRRPRQASYLQRFLLKNVGIISVRHRRTVLAFRRVIRRRRFLHNSNLLRSRKLMSSLSVSLTNAHYVPVRNNSLRFNPTSYHKLIILIRRNQAFSHHHRCTLSQLSAQVRRLRRRTSKPRSLPVVAHRPQEGQRLIHNLLPGLISLTFRPIRRQRRMLLVPSPRLLIIVITIRRRTSHDVHRRQFPIVLVFKRRPYRTPHHFHVFRNNNFNSLVINRTFSLPTVVRFTQSQFHIRPSRVQFSVRGVIMVLTIHARRLFNNRHNQTNRSRSCSTNRRCHNRGHGHVSFRHVRHVILSVYASLLSWFGELTCLQLPRNLFWKL